MAPETTSGDPAERHPDAGQIAPVGTGVDDVEAVGDDSEAEREQADEEPSARRVGRMRRGWAAIHAAGTATIASTPRMAVSGPDIARSSR